MTKPRKSKASQGTWKQIGTVCVDTGCITIGDQCRLVELGENEMYPGEALYKQIEQPAHGRPGDKIIPTVVSLRTGIGDGDYAVMAEFVDGGMIKAIVIEFLGDDFYGFVAAQKKAKKEIRKGPQPVEKGASSE